ncbi:hypothetical protein AAHH80_40230, partial [Burkholderia pseudomallei]
GRPTALTQTPMPEQTHIHPPALSPFPRGAPGAGGLLRADRATGRGARPTGAVTRYTLSTLDLPRPRETWENAPDAAQ